MASDNEIVQAVKERVCAGWKLDDIHGLKHWEHVEQFGIELCKHTGANLLVVRLFAYLHDSMRMSNGIDKDHGLRSALFAQQLRFTSSLLSQLTDEEFKDLYTACELHNYIQSVGDKITVNTCFDADRLDLFRVGILPDPNRMATKQGATLARDGFYMKYIE
jgi:uncharacterized protein